ncbi:MAG TPA: Rieske 2Fe-2S domain-containing protein [Chloroflexota bacterium]|nr:Rieske 2Fe-2S domain-containing protein [Chloroflexota bacterium]
MITPEQNTRLTGVGPGTPGGELLRRYWQPIAVETELTKTSPTRFVRLLGEDLVLFRDGQGRVGLLADRCAHRGASLLYGRVEDRGIACAYHGWLYDTSGACLETPAEPSESLFHLTVRQRAYPVQRHLGLYWAYLGPSPAPLLPTCGVADTWSVVGIEEQVEIRANWLQVMENNLDGAHFPILHQEKGGGRWPGARPNGTTRGFIDQCGSLEYWEEPWGIMRRYAYLHGGAETDALIFPNIRRHHNDISIKVPVDDVNTRKYVIYLTPEGGSDRPIEHWIRQIHVESRKTPDGRYRMDEIAFQDLAVMESQGRVSARPEWRMAASDRGLALFHELLLREMAAVERGVDPMGVARRPGDPRATPVLWEPKTRFRGNGVKVYPVDAVAARA